MMLSQKHVFSYIADYEILLAHQQWEKMLKFDPNSHEAMFGLGKLNFMIKRYETQGGDELSDTVKVAVVVKYVPEPLRTHLQVNSSQLNTYDKVRDLGSC